MSWAKAKRFYGTNASRMDERLSTTMNILDDWTSTTLENIAKVCKAILADRRQTIHVVCEIVGLSYGTIQCILLDSLNTRCISARFVPRLLSDDQKAHRVSVCKELKQVRDDPNFISNIITCDETWVCGYDPETKQQSSQWKSPNSPRTKKALQVRSNVKSMLIFFFRHPRHCPLAIRTPWSDHQWQVLLWGFKAAEEDHLAQTSRQVEEKQMVSPPRKSARSHITRCSTISDFQKHYSDSPLSLFACSRPLWIFPIPHDEITA